MKFSTSVNTSQLNPHNSFPLNDSRTLYLELHISISRHALASCGLEIEHQVRRFILLLFAVAIKTRINLSVTRWFIPDYSFLWKRVSIRRCLAMAVFSDFTIPAFRRHATILFSNFHPGLPSRPFSTDFPPKFVCTSLPFYMTCPSHRLDMAIPSDKNTNHVVLHYAVFCRFLLFPPS
jgi:hypothetical protein